MVHYLGMFIEKLEARLSIFLLAGIVGGLDPRRRPGRRFRSLLTTGSRSHLVPAAWIESRNLRSSKSASSGITGDSIRLAPQLCHGQFSEVSSLISAVFPWVFSAIFIEARCLPKRVAWCNAAHAAPLACHDGFSEGDRSRRIPHHDPGARDI
jgi:hypothetical protein